MDDDDLLEWLNHLAPHMLSDRWRARFDAIVFDLITPIEKIGHVGIPREHAEMRALKYVIIEMYGDMAIEATPAATTKVRYG